MYLAKTQLQSTGMSGLGNGAARLRQYYVINQDIYFRRPERSDFITADFVRFLFLTFAVL
jgi:hypothetical protein